MRPKILFIGNFLSQSRGTTRSQSEKAAQRLTDKGFSFQFASHLESPVWRLLHMAIYCLLGRYDKLHVDTFSDRSFWFASMATYIARWRRKHVILSLHGGKLAEFYEQHKTRVSNTFLRANNIVSTSNYLLQFFSAKGFSVQYLPNFIDLQRFRYKKPVHSTHSLLWVRAFHPIYNPQTAISTLAIVKQSYPEASMTMVGPDRGLLAECIQLAHDLGIQSSIQFAHTIPNEQLPEFYHSHRVFLNTTSYESFGMALMEAAACGIPIVSSSVGEIPLLWEDGKDILLTKDLDPEAYAKAIISLFENPSGALTQSEVARQKAESFDWKVVEKKWLELLR